MSRNTVFQELGQGGITAQQRINAGENPIEVMMEHTRIDFQALWQTTCIDPDRLHTGMKNLAALSKDELHVITQALAITVCHLLPKPVRGVMPESVLELLLEMVETDECHPDDGAQALTCLEEHLADTNRLVSDRFSPLGDIFAGYLQQGRFVFDDKRTDSSITLQNARQIIAVDCGLYMDDVQKRANIVRYSRDWDIVDPHTGKVATDRDVQIQDHILAAMLQWWDMSADIQEQVAQSFYLIFRLDYRQCRMHLGRRQQALSAGMHRIAPAAR